jgi:hypothetical protein
MLPLASLVARGKVRCLPRQNQPHHGPLAGFTAEIEPATEAIGHDAVDDVQAEVGATLITTGRKERIESLLPDVGAHTATIIGKNDLVVLHASLHDRFQRSECLHSCRPGLLKALRCTVPFGVRGNLGTNSIKGGKLYAPSRTLTCCAISSANSGEGARPCFNTTSALTISPRTRSGVPNAAAFATADLPDLVTFADINDSKTVLTVDPNDLQATLGPNITWNEITLESTDEQVTTGIKAKLPWLPAYYNGMLDGARYRDKNTLANSLSTADFDQSRDLKKDN